MYFWGASLIRCASCVLSHCWSTDIHAEENPWITQSEENFDFPSVHMQLNCVHCFYFWRLTLIKKKITFFHFNTTWSTLFIQEHDILCSVLNIFASSAFVYFVYMYSRKADRNQAKQWECFSPHSKNRYMCVQCLANAIGVFQNTPVYWPDVNQVLPG